jgi:hypothetical protein
MALSGEVSIYGCDQLAVLSHSHPARTNRTRLTKPNVYKIVMVNPDRRQPSS